jgi:hypothetical protein
MTPLGLAVKLTELEEKLASGAIDLGEWDFRVAMLKFAYTAEIHDRESIKSEKATAEKILAGECHYCEVCAEVHD